MTDETKPTLQEVETSLQEMAEEEKNDKRGNRVRRILDTKRRPPEHKRLDLEASEGGRSLLHDEFGLPKVSANPREEIAPADELPNNPILIKASVPDESKIHMAQGIPKRGVPVKSAEQSLDKDDGFVPPKSNFVNVGQTEHAWYDEKVTGPSEVVDNNEEVDTEGLQGLNPMVEKPKTSKARANFEKRLRQVNDKIMAQLKEVANLEQLTQFRANILGKNGVFSVILTQFKKLPKDDRMVMGALVNEYFKTLELEFDAKEYEFISSDEEEEVWHPEYEDDAPPETLADPEEEPSGQPAPTETDSRISALSEGDYAVLIDGRFFAPLKGQSTVVQVLSRLILGNNVDVERIQVIKRVPVDFGVILGE